MSGQAYLVCLDLQAICLYESKSHQMKERGKKFILIKKKCNNYMFSSNIVKYRTACLLAGI